MELKISMHVIDRTDWNGEPTSFVLTKASPENVVPEAQKVRSRGSNIQCFPVQTGNLPKSTPIKIFISGVGSFSLIVGVVAKGTGGLRGAQFDCILQGIRVPHEET